MRGNVYIAVGFVRTACSVASKDSSGAPRCLHTGGICCSSRSVHVHVQVRQPKLPSDRSLDKDRTLRPHCSITNLHRHVLLGYQPALQTAVYAHGSLDAAGSSSRLISRQDQEAKRPTVSPLCGPHTKETDNQVRSPSPKATVGAILESADAIEAKSAKCQSIQTPPIWGPMLSCTYAPAAPRVRSILGIVQALLACEAHITSSRDYSCGCVQGVWVLASDAT